jgi:5-formyltetrahydrofolate cyclo-ligase
MIASKRSVRRQVRRLARDCSAAERGRQTASLMRQLMAHPWLREAASVFAYIAVYPWEFPAETILRAVRDAGKTTAVPQTGATGGMRPVCLDAADLLSPNRWGIPEPPAANPVLEEPDLTIVPGVAFSPNGYRLGLGGGYYDRFLAGDRGRHLSAAYDFQRVDDLFLEPHDCPVEAVLWP